MKTATSARSSDGYVTIGGALDHDVVITGNLMMWGTVIAARNGRLQADAG